MRLKKNKKLFIKHSEYNFNKKRIGILYKIKNKLKGNRFIIIIAILLLFIIFFKYNKRKSTINEQTPLIKKNDIFDDANENFKCKELDPIYMFDKRLKSIPYNLCENGTSSHICYKNSNTDINYKFSTKNGVFCEIKNIIIDPSKWENSDPSDSKNKGAPILSKGFYNAKCENVGKISGYGWRYEQYFNAWDYEYKDNMENVEELAPGKTIFFMSRNNNSPNLFHGGSEIINVIALMNLLSLQPEDIKIIFLESMTMKNDPFYDLYKNLISRGGEPIHVKNLTKKYHISSAIHVPINWDSPCFIQTNIPVCRNSTKAYKYFNYLIDKYMNLKFIDSFISDNITFFYPQLTIDNYKSSNNFVKSVTIQWRRVWPKNRRNQGRLLGNGPELAEKLASLLPNNILVRLVDTASLPIFDQISIARNTDYFIGVHGAGLFLSIFTPNHCINHEILSSPNMNGLVLMSTLSGHKTYSNLLKSYVKNIDGNNYIFFDPLHFTNCILKIMKNNKFY